MKRKLLLILAVILACWACEEEEPEPTEKPWTENMLMGNFSVNGKSIVTHEDAVSLNYLTDYLNRSDLPGAALEYFTIHAYVPTGEYIETSVDGLNIRLNQVNGAGSSILEGNVVAAGEQLIGTQNYAVFRLSGSYNGQTAITASNFANVVFEFQVAYTTTTSKVLETRDVSLEVFKVGSNEEPTGGGGTIGEGDGSTTGEAMFWVQTDLGCGSITVEISEHGSKAITAYFSQVPECGAGGTATFSLPAGSYNYIASCNGQEWSGSISVSSGNCSSMQFTAGSDTGGGGDGGGEGGSTTGEAMFWVQSDLGCGSITVDIYGHGSKTITSYFSSGTPDCGSGGAATYNLSAGTYNYSASCSNQTWEGTITVEAGSCSKMQLTGSGGSGGGGGDDGGGGTGTGQGTFWTQSDLGCGSITVNVSGYGSKTISSYHSSGAPDCGSGGAATFDLPAGTYNYNASCSNETWEGTITINPESCSTMQLAGSGGGGGSTTGEATFWVESDLGCGSITVNVSGYGSKTITSYFSSGTPDCGSSGTATYNLPSGTYSYSASCSGKTWEGTIEVGSNTCSRMQLY